MPSRNKIFKTAGVILLFSIAFFGGRLAAARFAPADSARIVPAPENWGLGFQEDGKLPTGNATIDELKKYDDKELETVYFVCFRNEIYNKYKQLLDGIE